jgi:isoleucyl-tRNA synthetase
LSKSDAVEIINSVQNGGSLELVVNGEAVSVTEDILDIRITSKEGFNVSMANNLFVILDTNIDNNLLNEGYARELISKIQQMRKNNGYEMMDNIKVFFKGPEEIVEAVGRFRDYIMQETLAVEVIESAALDCAVQNLNGHDTCIELQKI